VTLPFELDLKVIGTGNEIVTITTAAAIGEYLRCVRCLGEILHASNDLYLVLSVGGQRTADDDDAENTPNDDKKTRIPSGIWSRLYG